MADRSQELPFRADEAAGPAPGTCVQGELRRVTFHSDETLFSVLKIDAERGYGDPEVLIGRAVTAVGRAQAPAEGLRVRLTGQWTTHPSHGRRFEFERFEVRPPNDTEGVVRYLSSKVFTGIGPKLAERIVEKLGPDTLETIRTDPSCLEGIRGLRPALRESLAETLREELGSHELHSFLLGLGLGPWQTAEVAAAFGPDCEARLRANPYLLAEAVRGIGFHTADRVAQKLGLAEDSPERLQAALVHGLAEAASGGHSFQPAERLVASAHELLRGELEVTLFEEQLETLARADRVVLDDLPDGKGRAVYLPALHTSETGLAKNLASLLERGEARALATREDIARAEERAGFELHELQREAVLGLTSHPVGMLTGGPGVGKTTIVRLVVELFERKSARVVLASPTGRAAKRLAEATGREASTIHRLLGWEPLRGGFAHHEKLPLEADVVVIDELSMVDVALAHHLLKAVQPPTRLVFVGDPDQLPSVQAGNVLADLIASDVVPTWRLERIFRQDQDSLIVENAHRILHGELPVWPERDAEGGDFFFFPAEDEESAAERLVEVVTERIPRRFGLDWIEDVQVLAPMYKGAAGVDELNQHLREALGHGGQELVHRGRVWRVGDRVIHTRNDYEKSVFNGDMGRIVRVNPDASGLFVAYPEGEVFYAPRELGDLQPAFAITVHRSQGGEFPCVVMPLVTRHFVMLKRHLLYTAITRARKLVVLVGSQRALRKAIDDADESRRESGLAARLRAASSP